MEIMRGLNSASVDLIYLDPPFNSKANYAAPIGSQAAGAEFKDTWTFTDLDEEWLELMKAKHPALIHIIQATILNSDRSYLIYMAARMIEMLRILKNSGSIYLHCDDRMSHYLKLIMDALFGRKNFKNEIIWKRTTGRSDAKRFGRVHDVVLYYTKGDEFTWKTQYAEHDPEYVKRNYSNSDYRGKWQKVDLMGPGPRGGESGQPWKGIDPNKSGRSWSTPAKGSMSDYIRENEIIKNWPDAYDGVHAKLDALDQAGLIYWPEKGRGIPRLKYYLSASKGVAVNDIFSDIGKLEAQDPERTGYPTQKPIKLLQRIINASSNEGDVVLDPFCGCATTCVAAESLNRKWIGIDISDLAAELVVKRIRKELGLFGNTIHRTDIPQRTDMGKLPPYNSPENISRMYGEQSGNCNGCRKHFEKVNLTIDHIVAKSKGGTDHIGNLQLLCGHCNSTKGVRSMEYLRSIVNA